MKIHALAPDNAAVLVPLVHQVHALHVEHQPEHYAPLSDDAEVRAFLQSWLRDKSATALIAGSEQAPTGYLIFEIEDRPASVFRRAARICMLHHICVDSAHRRKGVGKALFDEMRLRAKAEGCSQLATSYGAFNTASARLMASEGLHPTTVTARAFNL